MGCGFGMDKKNLQGQSLAEMPKFPRFAPNATRGVEVLVYPAVQMLDVIGPLQVFASANDLVAETGAKPPYALRIVAQGGQSIIASAGLGLVAAPLPTAETAVDTLIIAGGQGVPAAAADHQLADWVRERAKQARRVASVCTGAFSRPQAC